MEALEVLNQAYEDNGVMQALDKRERFAETFTAWGTTVEGRAGKAGVALNKRRQVARLVYSVARRGSCSKVILQSLVGSLVHPFMHRRCLMSTLQEVYKFIGDMPLRGECRLPAVVIDELLAGTLNIVFAFTDLRAEVSSTIAATDATNIRGGRCVATVPPQLARGLYRRGEQRGEHGLLRWSDLEVAELPTRMTEPSPELDQLAAALPWRAPRGFPFVSRAHINVQEARAVVAEVRDWIEQGFNRGRMVILIDSRVCVGAISKGRSSSKYLNAELRQLCALSLCGAVQVRVCWIGTKFNPADAPSRWQSLPSRGRMPEWAQVFWTEASLARGRRRDGATAATALPSPVPGMPDVVQEGRSGRRLLTVPFEQRRSIGIATSREYYSGCGKLSECLRRQRLPTVEFEAFVNGVLDPSRDLGEASVIDQEIKDIQNGLVASAHIGIVCSSWCKMNQVYNGGSRTKENPIGAKILQREIVGNRQLFQLQRLVAALVKADVPFTIENPHDSYIWQTKIMKDIMALEKVEIAKFDQCMFLLRPPGWDGITDVRVRKRTRIIGTVAGLSSISQFCDKQHSHEEAFGSVRVGDKRVSRAKAAGAYPYPLCRKLALLFAKALSQRQ